MIRRGFSTTIAVLAVATLTLQAGSAPQRARVGMVITQNDIASQIGFKVIQGGGNAIDAVVATAFVLAVTHPTAGNIGGGGFIVYRPAAGEPMSYDFREVGPSRSSPEMWLTDGKYDSTKHHNSHLSVGVPGTVAGLHLAWKEQGSKPWKELLQPAIMLARDGFEVSHGLARSLAGVLDDFQKYPASLAQFSKNGKPYEQGEILKQPDLAKTLTRIADQGPAGFYEGETAALVEKEMKANGGLITMADLKAYQAKKRGVVKGTLSRLRHHRHAAAELRRHGGRRDAEYSRGLRSQSQRLRLGEEYLTSSRSRCGARSPIAPAILPIRISRRTSRSRC